MEEYQLEQLRYPIGRFILPDAPDGNLVKASIEVIEAFPGEIQQCIGALSAEQLDTPYRPEGWTIRQVVHHVVDSHTNAYIRFKWGLTEDVPAIRTYREERWATLADVDGTPLAPSLAMLEALHAKWVLALNKINPEQWRRTIFHPGFNTEISLAQLVCQYSWHCRHHLGHINGLIERKGWT